MKAGPSLAMLIAKPNAASRSVNSVKVEHILEVLGTVVNIVQHQCQNQWLEIVVYNNLKFPGCIVKMHCPFLRCLWENSKSISAIIFKMIDNAIEHLLMSINILCISFDILTCISFFSRDNIA